ncbi:RICIN domain-containing protein [Paenibacillus hexagrammi]|uniref:RICIN domain-containing protein n=1 Tax=Paenibacillus hexagrammi TaxID=2908839 RepID=A0ABY3SCF5_9BACL|nr:RICIN domain-containing protein [Paenibacillus sp. YPD9-1]UJF31472.1 RICIN domain-containing protein [Paenibacillus sp. YPD9-1]
MSSASYFGSKVHATVWGVDNTGLNPSSGPYFVQEGDYNVTNGQITVPISNMKALSAYHMIITPATSLSSTNTTTRYEAEYADLSGSAHITYGSNTGYSGTYFVEGYGGTNNAETNFVVTAPNNGYYNVTLRYSAGPIGSAPSNRSTRVMVNGAQLVDAALTGTSDWNTWNSKTMTMFLTAGINRINFNAYTSDDSDAINIDCIDVTPSSAGQVNSYEAEATGNTLGGTAVVTSDTAASGGKYVGFIGAGASNTLQFNNVTVPTSGQYRMVVTYANGELGSGASNYNSNIVDRYADISVNNGSPRKVYFRNTLGWSNYRTTVVNVSLNAGSNTIKFSNSSSGYAPNIDTIQIAAPVTSQFDPNANYKLINKNSGKLLDVYQASGADGANVIQSTDNGGLNQKWGLVTTSDGSYKFVNRNSSKLLDVYGLSTADGGNADQWADNGGANQHWQIVDIGGGYYKLINVNSVKLLDVYGASTADGANVNQWADNDGANQAWMITP